MAVLSGENSQSLSRTELASRGCGAVVQLQGAHGRPRRVVGAMGFGAIAGDALQGTICSRTTRSKGESSPTLCGNMGSGQSTRAYAERSDLSLEGERGKHAGESFFSRRFGSLAGVKYRVPSLSSVSLKSSPRQKQYKENSGFNDISHSTTLADGSSPASTLGSAKTFLSHQNHRHHQTTHNSRELSRSNDATPLVEEEKSEDVTVPRENRSSTYDSLQLDDFDLDDLEAFDEKSSSWMKGSQNSTVIKPIAIRAGNAQASKDSFGFGVDPDFIAVKAQFTNKRNRRLGGVTEQLVNV